MISQRVLLEILRPARDGWGPQTGLVGSVDLGTVGPIVLPCHTPLPQKTANLVSQPQGRTQRRPPTKPFLRLLVGKGLATNRD